MDRAPVTTAIVDALTSGTAATTVKRGGIAAEEAPPEFPYLLVYAIPGGGYDGPMGAPHSDATFVYQVTSVGAVPLQAELLDDQAHAVMLALVGTSGEGWKIAYVEPDSTGGLDPDALAPSVASRYRCWVVPT